MMTNLVGDIATVMWKEGRELLSIRGTGVRRSGPWNLVIILVVFGVFLPLQSGRDWVTSPASLVYWGWVPLFLVTGVIADAIAGERERHTLETLLASRLPDQAILLGKAGAAVLYGWGLTLGGLLLGLVTVNVAHWSGRVLLYPPAVMAGGMVVGLLMAGLSAGVGVLVSLRAPTARQAAQSMSIAIMLLLFVPLFGIQALPADTRAGLMARVTQLDPTVALIAGFLVLLVLDVLLFVVARARFQRSRLILEG